MVHTTPWPQPGTLREPLYPSYPQVGSENAVRGVYAIAACPARRTASTTSCSPTTDGSARTRTASSSIAHPLPPGPSAGSPSSSWHSPSRTEAAGGRVAELGGLRHCHPRGARQGRWGSARPAIASRCGRRTDRSLRIPARCQWSLRFSTHVSEFPGECQCARLRQLGIRPPCSSASRTKLRTPRTGRPRRPPSPTTIGAGTPTSSTFPTRRTRPRNPQPPKVYPALPGGRWRLRIGRLAPDCSPTIR